MSRLKSERIPNDLLREAVLLAARQGRTISNIALAAEIAHEKNGRISGDNSSLSRKLGIKSYPPYRGYPSYTASTICIDHAERIMYALGLDPVEIGL